MATKMSSNFNVNLVRLTMFYHDRELTKQNTLTCGPKHCLGSKEDAVFFHLQLQFVGVILGMLKRSSTATSDNIRCSEQNRKLLCLGHGL